MSVVVRLNGSNVPGAAAGAQFGDGAVVKQCLQCTFNSAGADIGQLLKYVRLRAAIMCDQILDCRYAAPGGFFGSLPSRTLPNPFVELFTGSEDDAE